MVEEAAVRRWRKPTRLWLSELTHAYHVFAESGYEQKVVSAKAEPPTAHMVGFEIRF